MNQKEKRKVTIDRRDSRAHRVSLFMITGNFNLYTFIFPLCVLRVLGGEI